MSREQFEIWFLKECEPDFELRLKDGEYTDEAAQYMWEGWQAATESQGVEPVPVMLYKNTPSEYQVCWETLPYGEHFLYTHPPKPTGGGVPEEWRQVLQEMVSAMYDYQMDVEEPPPYRHRAMMDRANDLLTTQQPPAPTVPDKKVE